VEAPPRASSPTRGRVREEADRRGRPRRFVTDVAPGARVVATGVPVARMNGVVVDRPETRPDSRAAVRAQVFGLGPVDSITQSEVFAYSRMPAIAWTADPNADGRSTGFGDPFHGPLSVGRSRTLR
jgi:hypothetical protein